ncbi:hypothetical protein EP7_005081 [Isosphaeraceae bacterium EP7]
MTLDELEKSLPSGFHDADVASLRIDYVRREVVIEMDISVGLPDDGPDERDAYRLATVTISGLLYCCIEPPFPDYPYQVAGPLWVDSGSVESMKWPPEMKLPGPVPQGAFAHYIYVSSWNSCIYISAHSASIEWQGEARTR